MRSRSMSLAMLAIPLGAVALVGCPSPRGESGRSGEAASASASPLLPSPSTSPGRGRFAVPESAIDEATAGVPLRAGVALAEDPGATEGEIAALDLDFALRRWIVVPPSREAAFAGRSGVIAAQLADGRARVRFGAGTFALPDDAELRVARGFVGALWIAGKGEPAAGYHVVPAGALRTFLSEGRADVVPFGPTRVVTGAAGEWLGRPTARITLTTSYGKLVLDQIVAPRPPAAHSSSPARVADAGRADAAIEPAPLGLEGAGEPLCRAILELVASDRVLGGAPCDAEHVPVRAEISWTLGGALLLEATAIHEAPVARVDLAFPPVRSRLVAGPRLGGARSFLAEPARGDVATLELEDGAMRPRVAIVDGVPVGWIAPGRVLSLPIARGRRHVEWQSIFGELAEPAVDADVPARVVAGQELPAPLASASSMASARVQP